MSTPLSPEEIRAVVYIFETCRDDYNCCWNNRLDLLDNVLHDIQDTEEIARLTQKLRLEYATRKFQINNLTMYEVQCNCCGVLSTVKGVFMKPPPSRAIPHGNSKFIYKNTQTGEFHHLKPSEAIHNCLMERCSQVCSLCLSDITGRIKKQPMFAKVSGFWLGVLPPQCLRECTLAEEACLARVQCLMHFGMLPNGRGRSNQGGIVHNKSHIKSYVTLHN